MHLQEPLFSPAFQPLQPRRLLLCSYTGPGKSVPTPIISDKGIKLHQPYELWIGPRLGVTHMAFAHDPQAILQSHDHTNHKEAWQVWSMSVPRKERARFYEHRENCALAWSRFNKVRDLIWGALQHWKCGRWTKWPLKTPLGLTIPFNSKCGLLNNCLQQAETQKHKTETFCSFRNQMLHSRYHCIFLSEVPR